MLVVSKSSLEKAPACKRALAWMFHKKLRRPERAEYLELGRAFHAGLAAWYSGAGEEEAVARIRQETASYTEPERLFRWYIQNADDSDWKPVAVEIPFSLELGPGLVVGILDLIVQAGEQLWLVDHKTARSVGSDYFLGVERDPQVLLYEWAALQHGFSISGFVLNVIQKTKQPQLFRFSIPLDRRRVEWVGQHLASYLEDLNQLPTEDAEILALPGNPMACRSCPFAEVCELDHNPKEALKALELLISAGDIEVRDYERFAVVKEVSYETNGE